MTMGARPFGDVTECWDGPLDGVKLWFPEGNGSCSHPTLRIAEYAGDDGLRRIGAICQECGAVGAARDRRGDPLP